MRRDIILVLMTAALIFSFVGNKLVAVNNAKNTIAVISVPEIMNKSTKAKALQEKIVSESESGQKDMEATQKKIEAIQADMQTRKRGSEDYNKLGLEMMENKAKLEAHKQYYQQVLSRKNADVIEKVYQDILSAAQAVAKEKGYDLVLDKDDIQFPTPGGNELSVMIQTHKVVYAADYLDITEDVLKELDK